jgi:CheY-like chemotaxis protein
MTEEEMSDARLRIKVLIVEDHNDCREALVEVLETTGFTVVEAMTGEEGLEKTVLEKPDLIIMDLTLPGMSGIEATTRLKLEPLTSHIPVIAFTAWNEAKYKRWAEKAGVARFLIKPICLTRLLEVISEFPRINH